MSTLCPHIPGGKVRASRGVCEHYLYDLGQFNIFFLKKNTVIFKEDKLGNFVSLSKGTRAALGERAGITSLCIVKKTSVTWYPIPAHHSEGGTAYKLGVGVGPGYKRPSSSTKLAPFPSKLTLLHCLIPKVQRNNFITVIKATLLSRRETAVT